MMNTIATLIVLAVAGALVAAMILVVRLAADDSGRASELRQFVEALFGGAAGRQDAAKDEEAEAAARQLAAQREPFSEPCPACGAVTTHRDAECSGCGLRLL
ncbi:hypothetical protein SAMN02799624_01940 [Paenibacillus sp. UNC496MF]|uniref:hypothetical protein n=1 Tax=Paenibacillus sp. UNC496MF TaxID=1502753 RepID=UPI0008E48784|nr:hypothetical protein [Paenibacillus sp. UNC496MF]SFI73543.1 hypothetical protein SAMN02799624_01940 [Paenibacillus sp. UNC496MF]